MKIFYINSTHWDREWFMSFQGHRYNLVEMMDELLDLLERDPEYKLFCFDGQTIVLEDYIRIVPEAEARIRSLIAQKRLLVGPWYVMPDEFLVSGESLIRNLMTGHALAKKWGAEPWKYGYVNDIFGHIAQMPQIFSGFDIRGAYLGRGLGTAKYSHFVWQSPDGSKCYSTLGSYCNFARDRRKKLGTDGYTDFLRNVISKEAKKSDVPIVVLSNTDDHGRATADTPEMLQQIQDLFPEAELVHKDLTYAVQELKKHEDSLPVVTGELIETNAGGHMELLSHCLSSYYPLKQINDRCQNLLERRIQPLLGLMALENCPIRHGFVQEAYRNLLENHPHDSICGCSADQVHKDMVYRNDQVLQICGRLYDRFLENFPAGEGENYELRLYNFTPKAFKGLRTVEIDFHADDKIIDGFRILDHLGNEVPYQIISVKNNVTKRILTQFQAVGNYHVYTLSLEAEIPAFGYAAYTVEPGIPTEFTSDFAFGKDWAENQQIRLDIGSNGLLNIRDKRTGKTYSGLHEFMDNMEVGDGWCHETPADVPVYTACHVPAEVTLVNSGFAGATFRIEKSIMLPACEIDKKPSKEMKALKLRYFVTVKKDSPAITVELAVNNHVKDHRLRLLLPTGVEGDTYCAGQAFYCTERKTGVNPETLTWPEPEQLEKNMNGIVFKKDPSGTGLAFVSAEGLHECAVDADNTMAITLFRCFDRVYLQTSAIRSQLLEEMTFRYAIVPMAVDEDYKTLLDVQHHLGNTNISYSRKMNPEESTADPVSYMSLTNPNVRLSVFKCAEDGDGFILRFYNLSAHLQTADLTLPFAQTEAWFTNLNEENISPAVFVNNCLSIKFDPWQIKTIRVRKK